MIAEPVLAHLCMLGEGPVWDPHRQTIGWIDILNGEIHEYRPADGYMRTLFTGQMIGAFALCKNGHFIAALKNGFGFVDRNSGKLEMIANPESLLPGNRFNDGKVDPAGRFWAGTMSHIDEPEKGSLYCLDKDLSITKKINRISISNGMAWNLDQNIFYYIDTPSLTVTAFNYNVSSGSIHNGKVIIRIPALEGSPDGMTIDSDGMLWIAHWDGWQVSRWNPLTGKKLLTFTLPVGRVTSCCFGGEKFQDLYITTARTGLSDHQLKKQPKAGSLFVIKNIGYTGLPTFEF